MTTNHTPGPWGYFQQANSPKYCTVHSAGHRFEIADVWNEPCTDGRRSLANARLIAASPDMYAALTVIIDRLEAWAEYSERIARTEADSPRTEQHKNIAANYHELIRIARESMPKS